MEALGIALGTTVRDTDHLWNLYSDADVFREDGETDREFIFRKHFALWNPECKDDTAFEGELFLNGFKRQQIPILLSLLNSSSVFEQYVEHFRRVSTVDYRSWLQAFKKTYKNAKRVCFRQAYFSFLTKFQPDYAADCEILNLGSDGIRVHFQNIVGIKVERTHWNTLSSIVWTHGVEAGFRFVDTVLRKVNQFEFDDVVKLIGNASFTVEEMTAVVKLVRASLDLSDDNIKTIVADVLEPEADDILAANRPVDVNLRTRSGDNGDQLAMLCTYCGCMYLDTEEVQSGMCCKFGELCRFRLNPLPVEIATEIQIRKDFTDRQGKWRFPVLVRPLNNYFSFSTLHTTGFDSTIHNAINMNSGIQNSVFRVCGRTTTFIPSNVRPTLNTYIVDGISNFHSAELENEVQLLTNMREMLVRKNPLAATLRMWDAARFENFDITLQGHKKGCQPKELAVLLHRPNCLTDVREFDIRFMQRDWEHDSTRDTLVNVRFDDCRSEALHYPMLHVYGETGWGLQTCVDPETQAKASMREYLRFRFLSADVREKEYEGNENMNQFATDMDANELDADGLPTIGRAEHEGTRHFEPWMLTNRDKGNELLISTSRFHQFGLLAQEYLVDGWSRAVEYDASFVKAKQSKTGHNKSNYYLSSSFFGSPRFLREKKNDSLHIVNRKGMPLFFITLTCSKEWAEFRKVLTAGQEASDSPIWTARIFNAKLGIFIERLKNGSLFVNARNGKKFSYGLRGGLGEKGYCIHVVEFQKRGMPHAHICFRPWNGADTDAKIADEDYSFIDEIATAEKPKDVDFLHRWGMLDANGEVVPELCKLEGADAWCWSKEALLEEMKRRVEDFMQHGECTDYCHNDKFPDKCRFYFPFEPRESTGVSHLPPERRICFQFFVSDMMRMFVGVDKNTGILLFKRGEGDGRVVPYNPWILMQFNCHCNVQVCCSRSCIGYLYKYVFKGVDKAKGQLNRVDPATGLPVVSDTNELDEYLDGRYLSAAEAAWRVMGYNLYQMTAKVVNIDCHLPGDSQKDEGSSVLEKYFDRPTDPSFDDLTILDFYDKYDAKAQDWARDSWKCQLRPEHITNKGSDCFYVSERRAIDEVYVRLTMVPHKLSEKFALRQLLTHFACRGYSELRLSGETFMEAAVRRGLIRCGREGILAFEEAVELHQTPRELRSFLCGLMLDGVSFLPILRDELGTIEAANISALTADQSHFMTADDRYLFVVDYLHDKCEEFADCDGTVTFGLPPRSCGTSFAELELSERESMVLVEELKKWNVYSERADHSQRLPSVMRVAKQKKMYEKIVSQMESTSNTVHWHYAGGPAGTGKSFLAQTLLHYARGKEYIAKASAATWLAAGNFPDAVSIHSLFGLGISEGVDALPCMPSIGKQILLKHARLIVLDELPFLRRETFELINSYLVDMKREHHVDHPIIVLACGDFRQLAPVLTGNPSAGQIYENSILSSPYWRAVEKETFDVLIRQQFDSEYGDFVQSIGDGKGHDGRFPLGSVVHHEKLAELYGENLPARHLESMRVTEFVHFRHHTYVDDTTEFIRQVFPDLDGAETSLGESRAILCSTNQQKDAWNEEVQSRRQRASISLPADHIMKRGDLDADDMQKFRSAQVPNAELSLKIGDVLLIMAAVTVETGGICNNSRVILLGISRNNKVLRVRKIGSGQTFLIPRRWFRKIAVGQDGVFDRLQFPVQLAYAMTVHKCQGQTMAFVGVDATVPFFAHGQTYVAASRVTKRQDLAFFHPTCTDDVLVLNVVYKSFVSDLGAGRQPQRGQKRAIPPSYQQRRQRPRG